MTTDNNLPALLKEYEESWQLIKGDRIEQPRILDVLSASIALNKKLVEGLINIRRKAVAGFGGDYGDKHGEIYELAHALLELAKQHGVE